MRSGSTSNPGTERDRSFIDLFGEPLTASADAPGRVNLIGEHTDYHGGLVLPMVTKERTLAEVRVRRDSTVRAWSREAGAGIEQYQVGAEHRRGGWLDYVAGLTAVLRVRGFHLSGFDLRLESSLPLGAGLSSSAALLVSTLRALRTSFELALDDVALALAAQAAETDFVGAPVGVMDQMAASLGRPQHALFIDTRTLAYRHVPWPGSADLLFLDSGIRHAHAGGEYATRRKESFEAARLLQVEVLRDFMGSSGELERLPPVPARRARHVVSENQRVERAVDALAAGDAPALGRLFLESHASMRDDYEISLPQIDALVEEVMRDSRVYGARMTGGGFGGGVIVLTKRGAAAEILSDRGAGRIVAEADAPDREDSCRSAT